MNQDLRALAADPNTTAENLQMLAASHPELWVTLAGNPNLYPDLREWLKLTADPEVLEVLGAQTLPDAPPEVAGVYAGEKQSQPEQAPEPDANSQVSSSPLPAHLPADLPRPSVIAPEMWEPPAGHLAAAASAPVSSPRRRANLGAIIWVVLVVVLAVAAAVLGVMLFERLDALAAPTAQAAPTIGGWVQRVI